MTENKITLSFIRNQVQKKYKVETENIDKLLPNITTDNITELIQLIYAGMKLARDKIGVQLRNANRNRKPAR